MATPMAGNSSDVGDAEDDVIDLPYDESSISLPPGFAEAWNRSRDPGGDRLDIRKVLENLPYLEEVPKRPQDNNRNNDGKQYLDKTVESWQQKLLHGLRIIGNISVADSDTPDTYESLLQAFHSLSDLEQSICDFRKTSSIKCSVAHSNQLFNKEELANANLSAKINCLGRSYNPKGGKGGKGGRGYSNWGSNFRIFGKGKSFGRGYNSYSRYSQPSSSTSAPQGPRGQGPQ